MRFKRLMFAVLLLGSVQAQAFTWHDLWQRGDQQGYQALKSGKAKKAATLFSSPLWQGVANYRAKQFVQSAKVLTPEHSILADYNRGNALARLGQYEKAISAYNNVLKHESTYPDAKHNRDLLKKLLKQKKQHPEKNKKNQDHKKNKKPPKQNKKRQNKKQEKKSPQTKPKKTKQQRDMSKWLKKIPDDPGGLLRRKFLRDYQRRHGLEGTL